MLVLEYKCTKCDFVSSQLEESLTHGLRHRVLVSGYIAPAEPAKRAPEVEEREVQAAHEQYLLTTARNSEILRIARDRGLIPHVPTKSKWSR